MCPTTCPFVVKIRGCYRSSCPWPASSQAYDAKEPTLGTLCKSSTKNFHIFLWPGDWWDKLFKKFVFFLGRKPTLRWLIVQPVNSQSIFRSGYAALIIGILSEPMPLEIALTYPAEAPIDSANAPWLIFLCFKYAFNLSRTDIIWYNYSESIFYKYFYAEKLLNYIIILYICIVEFTYTAKVNRSTPQNNVKIYKKDWNNQIRKGEIVRQ